MPEPDTLKVTREIADGAKVSPQAEMGPFCVIGPEVAIGPGTVVGRRVSIAGRTTIGRDNTIADGCVIGAVPQDLKYDGGPTYLIIGDGNRLGPNVTVHVGTEGGGFLTRIGNDSVLEAGAHVAHDCFVDDGARLGSFVMLGGHVHVETGAVIEEMTGIAHFVTIGQFSRVASRTPVNRDVPPFTVFSSLGYYNAPPAVRRVHEAGLAAAGLGEADRAAVRQAVRHLFEDKLALAVKADNYLRQSALSRPVRTLCEFCQRVLTGRAGRYRETLRGRMPPEARQHLPPGALAQIEEELGPCESA
jgi:UDP-N-acetylglucosamine acyltransferase